MWYGNMKHGNTERGNGVLISLGDIEDESAFYLKRAFSAPRIWTVEAGYLARLVSDPAWDISRAPTYTERGEWHSKITYQRILHNSSERDCSAEPPNKGHFGGKILSLVERLSLSRY